MKTHLFLAVLSMAVVSCAGADDSRPAPTSSDEIIELPTLESPAIRTLDSRNSVATGSCTTGQAQECRIYLPTHNDIQPCFVGEQVCTESLWGDCDNAVLVDANDEDTELSSDDLTP